MPAISCAWSTPTASLLYVNHAWQQGTGYGEDEIGNLQLSDMIHPDSRQHYAGVIERVLAGERLDHVELVFVPKAGLPITVEGNLSCTFKDGEPVGGPRHLPRRHRAEASGGASPPGRADAGGRASWREEWLTKSTT